MIRIQAGPNGSIQGPCEAKWGYTTLSVADWDHDGLLGPRRQFDLGQGRLVRERRHAQRQPKLAGRAADRSRLARPAAEARLDAGGSRKGKQLVTQWRTTPVAVDWNRRRPERPGDARPRGLPRPLRASTAAPMAQLRSCCRRGACSSMHKGQPLQLNAKLRGRSGRRKLCATDWDGDGRIDFLLNGTNADLLRNAGASDGLTVLENRGPLAQTKLDAHDTSPTTRRLGTATAGGTCSLGPRMGICTSTPLARVSDS